MATSSVDGSTVPQAFLSYAHTDDRGLDGAISWLKKELETTVHLLTGRPFTIFQDRNDIEFGQNWSMCLDEALEQARFLIPILTPSYFMSVHCRDEAEKFMTLEAESRRHDLILPIYLIEAEVLEHPMMRAADSLATHLHKRQRSDWRDPEMQWQTNPKIKQKIINLARQIDRAMKRTASTAQQSHSIASARPGEGLDARKAAPAVEPAEPSPSSEPPYSESDAFATPVPRRTGFISGLVSGMAIVIVASLGTWYWALNPTVEDHPSAESSLATGEEPIALATIDQLKNRLAFAEQELAASAKLAREPGAAFRDCLDCPKMVIVPAGNFIMGSNAGMGEPDELPAHPVSIDRDFAIGAYEVTFAEWDACVADGGCEHQPSDEGWGQGDSKIRANLPVININWYDAQEYVAWLSKRTGQRYRLPSEAEWEYVARGGAETRYYWGDEAIGCQYANGADMTYKRVSEVSSQAVMKCDDGFAYTAPVGSFEPNGFGIYDTAGNVSEWVEDHKSDDYQKVPNDGSVHLDPGKHYNHRAIRGGDWSKRPDSLRSANRLQSERMSRESVNGFRVVRDLRD